MLPIMNRKTQPQIMILGVGNLLCRDEGVGIRVVEALLDRYALPENLSVLDGGTLGMQLLGTLSNVDYLIVLDVIRNGDRPGTLYRIAGEEIPKRIYAKNSLHDVDLLEALTLCQALDRVPETVILGVEPLDMESLGIELTPLIQGKVDALVDRVLEELEKLGVQLKCRAEKEQP
jgi:hydrogenase maturation protease